MFEKTKSLLHDVDPYEGFDHTLYPNDLHGWNLNPVLFESFVEQTKPKLIIEVGPWYGSSANAFATALKKFELDSGIVCVDTWLGAREMWTADSEDTGLNLRNVEGRFEKLQLKNGFPQFYYQFLANMVYAGNTKTVTPFPQTSVIAGRWFASHKIKAQLIYIDGSHEYEDVLLDLKTYWKVLDDDGIMFGDDWHFPDVQRAVKEFCSLYNQSYFLHEGENWMWWSIEKG